MEPCVSCIYLTYCMEYICVKIFIMNRYISKSYTTSKNIIDQQYTERGQLQCQLLLVLQLVSKLVGQQSYQRFRIYQFLRSRYENATLICVGCSVHYWMSCTCAINKEVFSRLHSSSTHICLAKSLKSTHSTKLMKKLY